MTDPAPSTTLLSIPPELLDEILAYLPYTSLLALSWTSIPLYNHLLYFSSSSSHSSFPSSSESFPPKRWLPHIHRLPPAIIFAHARHFTDLSPGIPADNETLRRELGGREVKRHEPKGAERRRCVLDLLELETWPAFDAPTAAATAAVEGRTANTSTEITTSAERRPRMKTKTHYACTICLKLLPTSSFTTAQISTHNAKITCTQDSRLYLLYLQSRIRDDDNHKSPTGGNSSGGGNKGGGGSGGSGGVVNPGTGRKQWVLLPDTRFCIECGVKTLKYQKGALLRFWRDDDDGDDDELDRSNDVDNVPSTLHFTNDGSTRGDADAHPMDDADHRKPHNHQHHDRHHRHHNRTLDAGVVCKRCGKFKVTGAETKSGIRRLCAECLAYRPI